ncbi:hypothetical protein ALT721_2010060 [Alteromonas alvinellae]
MREVLIATYYGISTFSNFIFRLVSFASLTPLEWRWIVGLPTDVQPTNTMTINDSSNVFIPDT